MKESVGDGIPKIHPHTLAARGLAEAIRRSGACPHACRRFSVSLIFDLENPSNARLSDCALAWFLSEYPAHNSNFIFSTDVFPAGCTAPSCPFCGSSSICFEGSEDNEGLSYLLHCPRCEASGPVVIESEMRAILAWSLRTTSPRDWLGAAFRGRTYEHPLPPDNSGELQACPFCGHTQLHVDGPQAGSPYMVSCDTCEAGGPSAQDCDGAIRGWNRRV